MDRARVRVRGGRDPWPMHQSQNVMANAAFYVPFHGGARIRVGFVIGQLQEDLAL